jgi:hypothetical protein
MTPEELMKPRYKVIADYPSNEFEVGQVIEFDTKQKWFTGELDWVSKTTKTKYGYSQFSIKKIDNFPVVVKKLDWWEEREIEDMPEYVKDKLKVVKTLYREIGGRLLCYDKDQDDFPYKYTHIQPATEQEYINQNTNK